MKFSRDGENRRFSTKEELLFGSGVFALYYVGVNTAENKDTLSFSVLTQKTHRARNPKRWEQLNLKLRIENLGKFAFRKLLIKKSPSATDVR